MVSSLSTTEQALFYQAIKDLVINKSKLIKDNYDGTSDKFFTDIIIQIAISEVLGYVCDYIRRPDRYAFMNPTIQYLLADMIVDVLTSRYNAEAVQSTGGGGTGAIDPTSVKQLKQGDTTIILKDDVKSATGHLLNLDDTLKNYKARLNQYRRII